MNLLDYTAATPAENLALDEALLATDGPDVLRFWAPRQPFVVVGYANKAGTEVDLAACRRRGVPVLRRCTGGGTVVQGPGILNYALVLQIPAAGPLAHLTSTNQFIMERNRAALAPLVGQPLIVAGHTDLALVVHRGAEALELKVAGSAQRRQRHRLLFHGSLLLAADLELIEELLPLPSREPGYRRRRRHVEFLANLDLPAARVQAALARAWGAAAPGALPPADLVARLVAERYGQREWQYRV